MDCPNQIAEIVKEATPFALALLAAVATYFPALAKGKRTPRREEHTLLAEARECTCGAHPSLPSAPPASPSGWASVDVAALLVALAVGCLFVAALHAVVTRGLLP